MILCQSLQKEPLHLCTTGKAFAADVSQVSIPIEYWETQKLGERAQMLFPGMLS